MRIITVTAADIDLFHLAAREYGDATQAYRVAAANGLSDFSITGLAQVLMPDGEAVPTDGLPPQ